LSCKNMKKKHDSDEQLARFVLRSHSRHHPLADGNIIR
jgi:hypothetical protein